MSGKKFELCRSSVQRYSLVANKGVNEYSKKAHSEFLA
jgi:hypothetical protein